MEYQRVGESCPENTKGDMTRGYHNLSAIPPGHSLEGFFAPEVDIASLMRSCQQLSGRACRRDLLCRQHGYSSRYIYEAFFEVPKALPWHNVPLQSAQVTAWPMD